MADIPVPDAVSRSRSVAPGLFVDVWSTRATAILIFELTIVDMPEGSVPVDVIHVRDPGSANEISVTLWTFLPGLPFPSGPHKAALTVGAETTTAEVRLQAQRSSDPSQSCTVSYIFKWSAS
jgi:hypothetical protein